MSEAEIIGRSLVRPDAYDKVCGRAVYHSDLKFPDTLTARALRSPFASAEILSIDVSRAAALPGVACVLTGSDLPDRPYGIIIPDETVLARGRVRYVGEEIALVAAETPEIAEAALSLIKIEYRETPAALTMDDALAGGAPLVHADKPGNIADEIHAAYGDLASENQKCSVFVSGTFETQYASHCALETRNFTARLDPHDGVLTLWGGTQEGFTVLEELAGCLDFPQERIRIRQTYMGGAFGSHSDQKEAAFAAALALRCPGRPVRFRLTREEEFCCARPRVPMRIYIKLGATAEGKILTKEMRVLADNGAYSGHGSAIMGVTSVRTDSLYRFAALKTDCRLVYTNKLPTGPFRGYGNVQSHFALERLIDELAVKLGMDPLELRKKNCSRPGDVTLRGWELGHCRLPECIERAAAAADYAHLKAHAGTKTPEGKLRGVGLAIAIHCNSNRGGFGPFDGSAARVRIRLDGRIDVYNGEVELGQGTTTGFAQIAAAVLGVDIARVQIHAGEDTEHSPFAIGTHGTRVLTLAGKAVELAALDARERLLAAAARHYACAPGEITLSGDHALLPDGAKVPFADFVNAVCFGVRCGCDILGEGIYNVNLPPLTGERHGNASVSYPVACHIAYVEVAPDTGAVEVKGYWAAHDVGRAINPTVVKGQIEGGAVQGLGFALMEGYSFDDAGRVKNGSFRDYKAPMMPDVPPVTAILVEGDGNPGPFGAKGIGEIPIIPAAPAVLNAIQSATGRSLHALPATAEKIYTALHA